MLQFRYMNAQNHTSVTAAALGPVELVSKLKADFEDTASLHTAEDTKHVLL